MKILIDINHPAHVHYFRNFINRMEAEGHSFIVTNRDDSLINHLLDNYEVNHIIRNQRKNNSRSKFQKFFYLLIMIFHVCRNASKHKVDAFLGFASSSCAISGFLLNKPSIILDDTGHNHLNHALYKRFATSILTPFYFDKHLRNDQVIFDAYIEHLYLEKPSIIDNRKYIFMRFIAYDAGHDSGVDINGLEEKRARIIDLLSKDNELIISCENDELKEKYKEYQGSYNPEDVHLILQHAKLVVSDGATMACESGILGTPYVYTNPLNVGNLNAQERSNDGVFIMSYDELILKLEDNLLFYKLKTMDKKEERSYINPSELLIWLFSDLEENIKLVRGQHITKNVFEAYKRDNIKNKRK